MGRISEAYTPRQRADSLSHHAHKTFPRNPSDLPQASFAAIMAKAIKGKSQIGREKSVEDLMENLDQEERDFADSPSRERFETYRKTVKALVNLLVARGYRLQGWEDKRKRRYEIVKVIDSHLATLYSSLLRRNQDVVIALHLMGQIRGLIFDLQA
ncbi:MAG: hypothetical protein LDLANPLL_01049 [Turneriella sp.]|nr:hypothetical protein [Turneriella sp.]